MARVRLLDPQRGNENKDTKKRNQLHENRITLRWMAKRWPKAFPDDTRAIFPLMIGIREVILDAVKDDPSAPSADLLLRALQMWTKSAPYVHAAAHGNPRVDLDGTVVSELDPKHQQFAKDVIDRRKQRAATPVKPAAVPVSPPRATTRPLLSLRRAQA